MTTKHHFITISADKPPESPDYGKCPTDSDGSDSDWISVEGPKCFYVSNTDATKTKSFQDAEKACENRGGWLTGITSKEENERVYAQVCAVISLISKVE